MCSNYGEGKRKSDKTVTSVSIMHKYPVTPSTDKNSDIVFVFKQTVSGS